jgi:hypothetical protein
LWYGDVLGVEDIADSESVGGSCLQIERFEKLPIPVILRFWGFFCEAAF